MPHVKTETVYFFEELGDEAKERARAWFREGYPDGDWFDTTFDDAVECARLMGIDISTSTEKYHVMGSNGEPGRDGQRQVTDIFFTGFWSQGDGASFAGEYHPKPAAAEAIKEHAPTDEKLHALAVGLVAAYELSKGALASVEISRDHGTRYSHEFTMDFTFHYTDDEAEPDDMILTDAERRAVEGLYVDFFRAFAKWIYRQLESAHDYLTSDEVVDETISVNEYEFTEDGARA